MIMIIMIDYDDNYADEYDDNHTPLLLETSLISQ